MSPWKAWTTSPLSYLRLATAARHGPAEGRAVSKWMSILLTMTRMPYPERSVAREHKKSEEENLSAWCPGPLTVLRCEP